MVLETERLEIVPLTPEQLALWAQDIPALERELQCAYAAEPMEGLFLEIVKGQLDIVREDAGHYLWHGFWLLIRKSDRVVVGAADFKGVPSADGEVEIGYGLGQAFEHKGYMTEAVRAMCGWAMRQPSVSHVIAETDAEGLASQRLLQSCGFVETSRAQTVWWRL
jgi:RimJ/RimL family protein N-acetyltransferase